MDTSSVQLDEIQKSIELNYSPYFIDDDFDESFYAFDWEIT